MRKKNDAKTNGLNRFIKTIRCDRPDIVPLFHASGLSYYQMLSRRGAAIRSIDARLRHSPRGRERSRELQLLRLAMTGNRLARVGRESNSENSLR